MQYWGKVIGIAMGILSGGGFWGAVVGLLLGHMFDRMRQRSAWFTSQQQRQTLFFNTLYRDWETDRKSTRLNSSHLKLSRMPSSA